MTLSVNLGPRLKLVASFIPQGASLGDIGTDHGYLPIYLWEIGRIKKAVAVDVHKGPYESACETIQSRNLSEVIDVRLGDGLLPLKVGEVDTLTLAGMGGNTMLEIFKPRPDIMAQIQHLILQPQGAEGKVRHTLTKEGWKLKEEELVTEEGRIYVVMHYTREEGYTFAQIQNKGEEWYQKTTPLIMSFLSDTKESSTKESSTKEFTDSDEFKSLVLRWVWDLGPHILENPTLQLLTFIEDQQNFLKRTLKQMEKATQTSVLPKIKKFQNSIYVLEGFKRCLFPLV
ncbi:MAG: SAM-dependent methyltransferase [Desulfitobacterium sp.]|nr:SAM-dependent methyltransferase [Desulfitobacterium sp.]